MADYTFLELAEEAGKRNISLGSNPVRTIRYYVGMELLPKPTIKQVGKKKVSCFNSDSVVRLRLVNYYKKKGLSLRNIKQKMSESIYWTEDAYVFVSKYKDIVPQSVLPGFAKGAAVTREQFAFFLSKFLDQVEECHLQAKELLNYFVDNGCGSFGVT